MAFFYFYCFFGWCLESSYVSIREKRFVNRGFLRGPVLPLYGCGAVMMLFVSWPVKGNYLLMFLYGMAGATVLEYLTGAAMEKLFKMRYWDYSDQKINFRGYICLSSSVVWGLLTIFLSEVLHKPVEEIVFAINGSALTGMVTAGTVVFLLDLYHSARAALDLAKTLEAMTRVKNSLEEIRVQMELMRSDAADLSADRIGRMKETVLIRYAEAKASGYVKIADFKEELQKRFAALQGIGFTKPEFLSIGDRLKEIKVPELSTKKFRERLQREILKRNPDATSKKFADAIRELKDSMRLR
jgi:uncharacterized membrane protein